MQPPSSGSLPQFQHGVDNGSDSFPPRATRSQLLKAALSYARKGIPVFPLHDLAGGVCSCSKGESCNRPGKHPRTKNGHLDASTDPRRVHMWWSRWPTANIGIPTGERSGLLVLDVDPGRGGRAALGRLEEERGIPATLSAYSGSGGIHLYFRYPRDPSGEIRSKADQLAPGMDHRAQGGYVIAPPSCTTGPYRWAERREIADPPPWMVEELAESEAPAIRPGGGTSPAEPAAARGGGFLLPEVIAQGTRNRTLFEFGSSLRGRGYDPPEIAEELHRANGERCAPALPAQEVEEIAASASRFAPGAGKPGPSAEVLAALDRIEARERRSDWRGMGGKSSRDVLVAAVNIARRHGRIIPAGVRVSVGVRALALAAGVSKPSAIKGIRRLTEAGWMRRDDAERKRNETGALVLIVPDGPGDPDEIPGEKPRNARLDRPATRTTPGGVSPPAKTGGKGLRSPTYSAPRLRWSAPSYHREGDEWVRTTIQRLGKSCGHVIDALEFAGGSMELGELARAVGVSRPYDLKRRTISRLEGAGVVESTGARIALRPDWREKLEEERDRGQEPQAQRRDLQRYARETREYRVHLLRRRGLSVERIARRLKLSPAMVREVLRPADEAPTRAQMTLKRWKRQQAEEAARAGLDERRYRALLARVSTGERIATERGPGKVWQVFSHRVGVVLDADPERVAFLDPGEITGEAVA